MATIPVLPVLSVTAQMAREMPVMAQATELPMAMPMSTSSSPIRATQLTLPATGQEAATVQAFVILEVIVALIAIRGKGLKQGIVPQYAFIKPAAS